MNKLIIEGKTWDNQVVDGAGKILTGNDSLLVRSIQDKSGKWVRPNNILIKNFVVRGSVRIVGLGLNGEAENVRISSRNTNHTTFCQESAPTKIKFENIHIEANKRIPFYVAPGCTEIILQNSVLEGSSEATSIYLCCESSHNIIKNNIINTSTKREAIAIDGSAYNVITNNEFNYLKYGGIYLYRNSGEGGTIRHQSPIYNLIADNYFNIPDSILFKLRMLIYPTIWVGSRSGIIKHFVPFKNDDKGYSFGSSINNSDLAKNNSILNNMPKNIKIRVWEK